jgi:hypothetical protein
VLSLETLVLRDSSGESPGPQVSARRPNALQLSQSAGFGQAGSGHDQTKKGEWLASHPPLLSCRGSLAG